jgi:hypothetical protein
MRSRSRRRDITRLVVTALIAMTGAMVMATLAGAQSERKPEPPLLVGGKLVTPPDMHQFEAYMERGPDGQMRLTKDVLVPVAGPDGQLKRNPDGSVKMVSLNNPDGSAPLEPGTPESKAMIANARANGVRASEGVTASGQPVPRGNLSSPRPPR